MSFLLDPWYNPYLKVFNNYFECIKIFFISNFHSYCCYILFFFNHFFIGISDKVYFILIIYTRCTSKRTEINFSFENHACDFNNSFTIIFSDDFNCLLHFFAYAYKNIVFIVNLIYGHTEILNVIHLFPYFISDLY